MLGILSQVKAGAFTSGDEKYEKAGIIETMKDSFYTMLFYIKSTIQGFVQLITFSIGPDQVMRSGWHCASS